MTTPLTPSDLVFLPHPQKLSYEGGYHLLSGQKLIAIQHVDLFSSARRLQNTLASVGIHWQIVVNSAALSTDEIGVYLMTFQHVGYTESAHKMRRYELSISNGKIVITGDEYPESVWYGVCTLCQIIEQRGLRLPCLSIEDYPDFARRGVMLDISRDKVPTMATLYALIDKLAGWKINEIQLYTEHTFAYRNHKMVWADASPLTGQEILALDAYCRERYIDLVPNQNSFGHMHRWLKHKPYLDLAEVPEGLDWPLFLNPPNPFGLSPAAPGSIDLIRGLYDELLPHFTSQYLNVGCDETADLGKGRSAALVEAQGAGRVYLNFLNQIAELVRGHGRTMMFWGDIILEHPDLIASLPPSIIALNWGYEADHPFEKEAAKFAEAKIPFYVCPGTSSWLSLLGRTDNTIGNLRNAALNGKKFGARGYLNTDWGDYGHHQPLSASYLGFAYGAAVSWCVEANREINLAKALDRFAFHDPAGAMGRTVYDLGNAYQKSAFLPHANGAHMARTLYIPLEKLRSGMWLYGQKEAVPVAVDQVKAAMAEADRAADGLANARPADPLVLPEYRLAVALWKHGCKRLLLAADDPSVTRAQMGAELRALISEQSATWLARNRPGGLGDSLARLTPRLAEYA
jgi:hexosaminidase